MRSAKQCVRLEVPYRMGCAKCCGGVRGEVCVWGGGGLLGAILGCGSELGIPTCLTCSLKCNGFSEFHVFGRLVPACYDPLVVWLWVHGRTSARTEGLVSACCHCVAHVHVNVHMHAGRWHMPAQPKPLFHGLLTGMRKLLAVSQPHKFYCLQQVNLAENLPQATHTQNRVKTT